jgi:hypothetical protein
MNLIGGIFDVEAIVPMMIFAIPIVAIVGGITSSIVKTMTDARVIENAQRERLAAIQRGMDLDKLPPLPAIGENAGAMMAAVDPIAAARHRAQGLLIAGVITMFGGLGLAILLYFVADATEPVWVIGVMPVFVGVALLLSAWIVTPKGGNRPAA